MTIDNETLDVSLRDLVKAIGGRDPRVVANAATILGFLIPRLDLATCLADPALRKTLRPLPDRLYETLVSNLAEPESAKRVAFALVAAVNPVGHARDTGADESAFRHDLTALFESNGVDYLLTVRCSPSRRRTAIDVDVWNAMPFHVNGERLAISEEVSEWSVVFQGAVIVESVGGEPDASTGRCAALRLVVSEDPTGTVDGKVIMDIVRNGSTYSREVFDREVLFTT